MSKIDWRNQEEEQVLQIATMEVRESEELVWLKVEEAYL
jgi:hypothetical protein